MHELKFAYHAADIIWQVYAGCELVQGKNKYQQINNQVNRDFKDQDLGPNCLKLADKMFAFT